jgi:hypothetical protein
VVEFTVGTTSVPRARSHRRMHAYSLRHHVARQCAPDQAWRRCEGKRSDRNKKLSATVVETENVHEIGNAVEWCDGTKSVVESRVWHCVANYMCYPLCERIVCISYGGVAIACDTSASLCTSVTSWSSLQWQQAERRGQATGARPAELVPVISDSGAAMQACVAGLVHNEFTVVLTHIGVALAAVADFETAHDPRVWSRWGIASS